jgi:hypothetical protein
MQTDPSITMSQVRLIPHLRDDGISEFLFNKKVYKNSKNREKEKCSFFFARLATLHLTHLTDSDSTKLQIC